MTYVCAPSPFQHATAAGLETLPREFYRQLAEDHQAKRSVLVDALREAGLTPRIPEGAYYILADVGSIPGANAAERARTLLRESGVAGVAGSAFFRSGQGEEIMRFCFAKKDSELAEAAERLRAWKR